MSFIFSRPVDELTHEQIASECLRSGNDELVTLGEELQEAVDAEKDSAGIVAKIVDAIESVE